MGSTRPAVASAILDDLASRARAVGVTAVTHALKEDRPEGIVSVAQKRGGGPHRGGEQRYERPYVASSAGPQRRCPPFSPCSVLIVQTT